MRNLTHFLVKYIYNKEERTMKINSENLVSITEANQNFSKVARLVDEKGSAIILKNNTPKYVLLKYDKFNEFNLAEDEEIEEISQRLMRENAETFRDLAK